MSLVRVFVVLAVVVHAALAAFSCSTSCTLTSSQDIVSFNSLGCTVLQGSLAIDLSPPDTAISQTLTLTDITGSLSIIVTDNTPYKSISLVFSDLKSVNSFVSIATQGQISAIRLPSLALVVGNVDVTTTGPTNEISFASSSNLNPLVIGDDVLIRTSSSNSGNLSLVTFANLKSVNSIHVEPGAAAINQVTINGSELVVSQDITVYSSQSSTSASLGAVSISNVLSAARIDVSSQSSPIGQVDIIGSNFAVSQ
jgi:hypothetical protein